MQKKLLLAMALLLPVGVFFFFAVDPTTAQIYPKCVFYWATGLHCPGCGTARCLHALAHGRLLQAAAYNILTLICLAVFLVWIARRLIDATVRRQSQTARRSLRLGKWVLWLVVSFWILRNIPVYPFTLLAPHVLGGQ